MQTWTFPTNWQTVAALGVALATVFVVIFIAAVRRGYAKQKAANPLPSSEAPGTALTAVPEPASQLHTAPISMIDRSSPVDQHPAGDSLLEDLPADAFVPAKSKSWRTETVQLGSEPQDEAGPEQKCAGLLVLAQNQINSGAPSAAAGALRDVIRLAAANGLHGQHATARLELGELSRLDGDLITACEHWQIARGLFYDLKNGTQVKVIETRMRDHGCPTDWVLNDF